MHISTRESGGFSFLSNRIAPDRLRRTALLLGLLFFCWILLSATARARVDDPAPTMAIPGQLDVNAAGAATYTIPMETPPGTAGMEPALSLEYSSQNRDGIIGLGWMLNFGVGKALASGTESKSGDRSLPGSSIGVTTTLSDGSGQLSLTPAPGAPSNINVPDSVVRCPRTIAQDGIHGGVNYDMNDRFCVENRRLVVVSGAYGSDASQYRTEIESFNKVIAHGNSGSGPAWFEIHTKSGITLEFGNTADSRILAVGKTTARAWALNKVKDVKGNYFTVSYSNDTTNGQFYPVRLDFTGNASTGLTTYNSVQFSYIARNDVVPTYQAGSLQQITVLLSDIKTYAGSEIVSDYKLAYTPAASGASHDELNSVTRCDGSNNCLAPTTFGWQGSRDHPVMSAQTPPSSKWPSEYTGDFNGDGLTDYITATGDSTCSAGDSRFWGASGGGDIYLGQQNGTYIGGQMTIVSNGTSSPACFPVFEGLGSAQLYPDVADISGDGFADVIVFPDYDTESGYVPNSDIYNTMGSYINDKNGHFTFVATAFSSTTSEYHLGNFHGDGRADVYLDSFGTASYFGNRQYPPNCSVCASNMYFSNGDGTFNQGPNITYAGGVVPTNEPLLGDFDGDGCDDVWATYGPYSSSTPNSWITVNPSCNPAVSQIIPPSSAPILNQAYLNAVLGDFNGDGITDFVVMRAGNDAVLYLSTGTGFAAGITIPNTSNWGYYSVVTGDWNGDGKTDFALFDESGSNSHVVMLSKGNGFVQLATIPDNFSNARAIIADWNNDGASDFWVLPTPTDPPSPGSPVQYLFAYVPELVTSVSNGVGKTTAISYNRLNKNGSFYIKGTGAAYPTRDADGPLYVVSEVDTNNGLGVCAPPSMANCYSTTYAYAGAKTDLNGRGSLGFSQVTITDHQTNIVETTNYRTDFPYIGLISTQTKMHGGITLSSISNSYDCRSNGSACNFISGSANPPYFAFLTRSQITVANDLDGTALPTSTTSYTYDAYGNALTVNVSVSDGSSKNSTNTYTNDTTNWFLGELTGSTVISTVGSSIITRSSSFVYDAATSLLTSAIIEPTSTGCNGNNTACKVETDYAYDSFGNRTGLTISGPGIATRSTTASYDSLGEFQTGVCNALNQCESWTYDARFGLRTSYKNLNNLTTAWAYDTLGRITLETRPDGNKTAFSYSFCTGLPTGESCPASVGKFDMIVTPQNSSAAQNGPTTISYYDGLSRSIAKDTQGFDGSWITAATQYDPNERIARTSRPFFLAGGTAQWTNFSYDDLGRVSNATAPDTSSTAFTYHGLTSSVTDTVVNFNGQSGTSTQTSTIVRNAQGLIASVTDALNHTSSYVDDALGNLTKITDPSGNVTTYDYDLRGNKISAADPDRGVWTYTYDVLGELLTQTDTRPSNAPAFTANYVYDTALHGVGMLASASTSLGYVRVPTYDSVSRPSSTTLTIDGSNYSYATSYDSNGHISTESYPSSFVAQYLYTPLGYLSQIKDNGSGQSYWTINARDAELHLLSQMAGNSVTTTNTFDAATGRLTNIRAGASNSVASFDYHYDSLGNLNYRADGVQGVFENFCVDALNRLTNYSSAQGAGIPCNGAGAKSVAYDALGNITAKSDVGTYSYPAPGQALPHAVSSIVGTVNGVVNPTFAYDADGNLIAGDGRAISYNAFNATDTITQGATSIAFSYDSEKSRVKQCIGSSCATSATYYLNDPTSETMSEKLVVGSTTTWHDFIKADGHIIAERFNAGGAISTRYFTLDHLGSIAVLANESGAVTERDSYDAWGRRRNANGTDNATCAIASATTRGFTGHEEIDSDCLVNANARIYDPTIGRFASADDASSVYDAQGLNRYSYVNNRPLFATDPTGQYDEEIWTSPNNVIIVYPVTVRNGSGWAPLKTPESAIARRADADWSGAFINDAGNTIHVTWKTVFFKGNDPRVTRDPNLQKMNVIVPDAASEGADRANTSGNLIRVSPDDGPGVISHEIGHTVGANDHYTELPNGGSKPIDPVTGESFKGNLMGDSNITESPNHVTGSVDRRNYREIIRGPENARQHSKNDKNLNGQ